MDQYYSTADAAAYLQVSTGRIKQWVVEGRLPHNLFAGRLVFTKADLDGLERRPTGNPTFQKKRPKSSRKAR